MAEPAARGGNGNPLAGQAFEASTAGPTGYVISLVVPVPESSLY